MIYTIGYQHLKLDRLVQLVTRLQVVLIDVRSTPVSRIAGFGERQLRSALGPAYEHHPELGGRTVVADSAIRVLARYQEDNALMMMCMEHAPGECHRHRDIAQRLLALPDPVDCAHICGDELVMASELQRAIDADDTYEYFDLPEASP